MAQTRTKAGPRTSERILDIAERLIQTRGFGNVSYGDIAAELGITTASLHYHYRGKAELGHALLARYAQRFGEALEGIDRDLPDAHAKLMAYAGLYADVLRGKRMCLCGILAAEYQTLPKPMRTDVIRFFDDNEKWLTAMLLEGQGDGSLSFDGSAAEVARAILSTLEGAMLVARPYGDLARFETTAHQLIRGLTP